MPQISLQRWSISLALLAALVACGAGRQADPTAEVQSADLFEVVASPTHDHSSHDHGDHEHSTPDLAGRSGENGMIRLSGSGEASSSEFALAPGLALIHIDHPTASPFAAYLLDSQGNHLALLANNSIPVSGTRAVGIANADSFSLHVIAVDSWQFAVEPQPVLAQSQHPPLKLQGDQPRVIAVSLTEGRLDLSWSHKGRNSFTLRLLRHDGSLVSSVADTSGTTAGQASITIESPGTYLLDLLADGDWQLELAGP